MAEEMLQIASMNISASLSTVQSALRLLERFLKQPSSEQFTATTAVSTMREVSAFKSGRELAGLAPKQIGSGDKVHLHGISKRGDTYLRTYPWDNSRT